jgi:hypothetical protein
MNVSATSYDWFFAPTRTKVDTYQTDTTAFENKSAASRATMSVGSGCSDTLNPAVAMADQPGMIAIGGYGQPGGGCKVDENTQLQWGLEGAHRQKGPKQQWARPFATTPFLGGGEPQAVDDESGLIRSAPPRGKKESTTIMDRAIPNYYQPLLSGKKAAYEDVNHWIEQWTRGGDATRTVQMKRPSE